MLILRGLLNELKQANDGLRPEESIQTMIKEKEAINGIQVDADPSNNLGSNNGSQENIKPLGIGIGIDESIENKTAQMALLYETIDGLQVKITFFSSNDHRIFKQIFFDIT